MKWKNIAIIDVDESERVVAKANEIKRKNLKSKDALHIACAIEAGCEYFITADGKILNKIVHDIITINPIDFVRMVEE